MDDIITKAFSKDVKDDIVADVATPEPEEKNDGRTESASSEVTRPEENGQVTEPTATVVQPEGGDKESSVPSWRLREIREEYETKIKELQAANQPKPVEQPIPNKDLEYDAWLEHKMGNVEQTLNVIQEQQALSQIGQSYASSVSVFTAKNPDFNNCLNNMAEIYAMQLAEDGLPHAKIEAAIKHSVMSMTVEALKKGQDPADYIYRKGKHLPRLPQYSNQPAPAREPKELDIKKLNEAKRRNSSISGDSGDRMDDAPKIFNESPLDIAFGSKEKHKEWQKERDKLLKHV